MSEAKVLVIGAGAWGTALAAVFARAGTQTYLWDADAALMEQLQSSRRHPRLCPEIEFPDKLRPLAELTSEIDVDCAMFVVPFQVLRAAYRGLRASGASYSALACASKGFELDTLAVAHEIIAEESDEQLPFAQVSGPNFAAEVMRDAPAAITVGASDTEFGQALVSAMHGEMFRPYLTDDVVGVEIGGALKNVIAIAAGIVDGLQLGSNTRAALITRGLAEMARLGVARGARAETFMGLSGMGDLVLTCTDDQSRNRRFGLALARYGDIDRAASEVGALVEGVATARALARNGHLDDIALPIAREVAAVIDGNRDPRDVIKTLLEREIRFERE